MFCSGQTSCLQNFCSPRCYKASKHLEKQIPGDPVWSRKSLPPRKVDLLPLHVQWFGLDYGSALFLGKKSNH